MGLTERTARRRAGASDRMRDLQQDIMALILERGLASGDAMPTENELVEQLGAGRNTVREALKALQSMGIVEVRHGYGMFVGRKSLEALAMGLEFHARMSLQRAGDEAMEVVEVRQALESGLIGAAMEAMNAEDHEALSQCVRSMEEAAQEGSMDPAHDREFHRLLFAPLNNGLLASLMEVFWSVYGRIREQIEHSAPAAQQNARAHRDILNAVLEGDQQRASQLLRTHLEAFRESLRRATS